MNMGTKAMRVGVVVIEHEGQKFIVPAIYNGVWDCVIHRVKMHEGCRWLVESFGASRR